MGNFFAKPIQESATAVDVNNSLFGNLDPRSPSPAIPRTPIRGSPVMPKKIANDITEDQSIQNNPIINGIIKSHYQIYDPRSPTQDFERTPVIPPSKVAEITSVFREKIREFPKHNLDDSVDPSLVESEELEPECIEEEFNSTQATEPLGSSTSNSDDIKRNISSENNIVKGLLETNLDDCDSQPNIIFKPKFKILDEDPRSPSIGIDRTPIVVTNEKDDSVSSDQISPQSSLIKTLQETNVELRQCLTKEGINNGLLIYEDDAPNCAETPKKTKAVNGTRTPLSCMKNKDKEATRSKSATNSFNKNVELVKHRRSSNIPRLKALKKTSSAHSDLSLNINKIISDGNGDCENTPPNTKRELWDVNNSIVL